MSLRDNSVKQLDPEFQRYLEVEVQRQKFKYYANNLTNTCWEVCMGKPSSHLDSKTVNCLANCVDRFLDTNYFLLDRLNKNIDNLSHADIANE